MNQRIRFLAIQQVILLGTLLSLAITGYCLFRYPGILFPLRVGIGFAAALLLTLVSYLSLAWRLSRNMDSDASWSARQGMTWGILIAGFWLLEIVAGNLLDSQFKTVRAIYFGSSVAAFSLPFFAGVFGAWHSGLYRTGLSIGVWSGVVSGLLTFLNLMVVTFLFLNHLLGDPQNILEFQGSAASDLTTFVIGDSLAGATGHLVIGLVVVPGFAAMGAVLGKSFQRPICGSETP